MRNCEVGERVNASKGGSNAGFMRVWGAPLELARPAENPQIFRVGGRGRGENGL